MLVHWGNKLKLSDQDIIAVGMAIAEEYSAREDYGGIKRFIDEWQDYKCKRGWSFLLFSDFGKANISQHTAQNVDLSPLGNVDPNLKKGIAKILESEKNTRKFLVSDDGTVLLSLLIMIETIKRTAPYTGSLTTEGKAQLNVNAWREGPRIIERMEDNKRDLPDPSSYVPSSGMKEELVKKNYEDIRNSLRL